jgi:hypothetical protein
MEPARGRVRTMAEGKGMSLALKASGESQRAARLLSTSHKFHLLKAKKRGFFYLAALGAGAYMGRGVSLRLIY